MFTDLAKRGLADRAGVDPELERAIRTVSDYVIAVAVMGTVEKNREIYARASATGETGVLAVKEKQSMRFELIRPTGLALALAGLLPKAQAGPGQSVTVSPAPAARHRRDDDVQSVFGDRPRASTDQQLRAATAYLARPRTGTGFFAVSARDRHGREVRARRPDLAGHRRRPVPDAVTPGGRRRGGHRHDLPGRHGPAHPPARRDDRVGRARALRSAQTSSWAVPGMRPVTTNTTRLATDTAWSAKRS